MKPLLWMMAGVAAALGAVQWVASRTRSRKLTHPAERIRRVEAGPWPGGAWPIEEVPSPS